MSQVLLKKAGGTSRIAQRCKLLVLFREGPVFEWRNAFVVQVSKMLFDTCVWQSSLSW